MLLGKIFIIVFIGQITVISIIIYVLWKILDRQLCDSATHKLETLYTDEIDQNLTELNIVIYGDLSEKLRKRIKNSLLKKLNREIKLNITKDKTLKGGMIIQLKDKPIDCSLLSRLREGEFIKS